MYTTEFPKALWVTGMEEETKVEINGHKVLFDKKVTLLPVELKKEKKWKAPNKTMHMN